MWHWEFRSVCDIMYRELMADPNASYFIGFEVLSIPLSVFYGRYCAPTVTTRWQPL